MFGSLHSFPFSAHLSSDKQEVSLFWLLTLFHGFSCFLCEAWPSIRRSFIHYALMSLILTFIIWNVVFSASCNWSPSLLHHFLYQVLDYSVVVHPKEGVKRMWGEEKEKSQFSQPHWWLPYGVFWGKAPPESFNSNYCQHFAAALT